VSCIGYIGKVGVVDTETAVTNQQINAIIPRIVDNWFLAYSLLYEAPLLATRARKTTVPILNKTNFERIPIPLPPLAEQRAIAQVLRTVQEAREATERVINAARELKKSLMRHLFTYGPVPVDAANRVSMQDTPIGPLPAHWRVVRLGEVAEVRGGKAFPHRFQGKESGRYPFFKVSDMNLHGNEIYMRQANNYVDEEERQSLRARAFPPSTTVFPKVGGALHTNKKRLLAVEALIDNNMMGVVPSSSDVSPEFLFRWFETVNLSDLANPGPLPSITGQRVKSTLIPIPPSTEQTLVVKILQTVDRRIEAEEARARSLQALFKTLLHHLMTARVRLPAKFIARLADQEAEP